MEHIYKDMDPMEGIGKDKEDMCQDIDEMDMDMDNMEKDYNMDNMENMEKD